eukprot:286134_1
MSNAKLTPYHKEYYKKKRREKNKVKFRTSFRNTIFDALKYRGWSECNTHDIHWDIMWADREWMRAIFDTIHLEKHQKVNHFRNHYELTRKDMMAKNIKKQKRVLLRNNKILELEKYNFIPQTFTLPHEYAIFVEEFKKLPNTQWIMKPVGKCQGRGIFLFTKLSHISNWKYNPNQYYYRPNNKGDEQKQIESYVVQKYINNPYLIGNKKFDLRIYVLVTSYSPDLIVYIYRSGFARFTSLRYSNSNSNLDNTYMHLTNAAVQKTNDEYNRDNDLKWSIRSLKLYLITKYGEEKVNILFKNIQDIIIKSLICVQNVIINDKHCFELYGYDILIDNQLKPWLIEINAAPSFSHSSHEDHLLKFSVISDCLDIVMNKNDQNNDNDQLQFGGFDLVYKGGNVQFHERCLITSNLGCQNSSLEKYKKVNIRIYK